MAGINVGTGTGNNRMNYSLPEQAKFFLTNCVSFPYRVKRRLSATEQMSATYHKMRSAYLRCVRQLHKGRVAERQFSAIC